jgi:hypothetical protein
MARAACFRLLARWGYFEMRSFEMDEDTLSTAMFSIE